MKILLATPIVLATAAVTAAAAPVTFQTIAVTGETAPGTGGGVFVPFFGLPSVNNSSTV
ncbi:MAG: hypothetical protein AAGI46_01305 [Planctomycetota bacterium]